MGRKDSVLASTTRCRGSVTPSNRSDYAASTTACHAESAGVRGCPDDLNRGPNSLSSFRFGARIFAHLVLSRFPGGHFVVENHSAQKGSDSPLEERALSHCFSLRGFQRAVTNVTQAACDCDAPQCDDYGQEGQPGINDLQIFDCKPRCK